MTWLTYSVSPDTGQMYRHYDRPGITYAILLDICLMAGKQRGLRTVIAGNEEGNSCLPFPQHGPQPWCESDRETALDLSSFVYCCLWSLFFVKVTARTVVVVLPPGVKIISVIVAVVPPIAGTSLLKETMMTKKKKPRKWYTGIIGGKGYEPQWRYAACSSSTLCVVWGGKIAESVDLHHLTHCQGTHANPCMEHRHYCNDIQTLYLVAILSF